MALLACVDGSVLGVLPVPVLDRDGVPYEVTLRMTRDGLAFGEVGFPLSSLEGGLRAWAHDVGEEPDATWEQLQRYLPRDRELFCFRSRDPDDLALAGELRATLQVERQWTETGWTLRCLAVMEAWGDAGQGVRALCDSPQLLSFLESLVQDFAQVGAAYEAHEDAAGLRRPVG